MFIIGTGKAPADSAPLINSPPAHCPLTPVTTPLSSWAAYRLSVRRGAGAASMSSHGSRVTASGLAILFIAVSVAIGFCGYGQLLSLLGVLAGANLIAVGVKMADDPAALSRLFTSHGIASLTAYLRRNLAVAGLVAASSAVTAVVAGDPGQVLCFAVFALFLLGISLVTLGVVGRMD